MEKLPDLKEKFLYYRKQRGIYYTRYPIPEDLRHHYLNSKGNPDKHVKVLIDEGSASEIREIHRQNIGGILNHFEQLRIQDSQPSEKGRLKEARRLRRKSLNEKLQDCATSCTVSDSMMAEMLLRWYESSYETARKGLQYFIDLKKSRAGDMNGEIPDYLDDMHQNLLNLTEGRSFEEGFLNEAVDLTETKRILLDNETNLDQSSHSFRKMKRYVWEIMTELHQWEKDCFESGRIKKFKSKTVDELSSMRSSETQMEENVSFSRRASSSLESKSIDQLFDSFVEWKRKQKDHADTFDSDISLLRRFVLEVWGNLQSRRISSDEMEKLRDSLSSLPNRRGKEFQTVDSFLKAIKIGKESNSELITHKTANKLLGYLVSIFKYAGERGWFDSKLLLDFKIKFNDHNRQGNITPSEERREFSKEELTDFFGIPVFSGCLNDKHGLNKEGNKIYWNFRYWGVLIALYTGMRPAEIAEMRLDQIEDDEGILFFNILKKHKGQSLKTTSSVRKIPIHKDLIELGFLDYIGDRESNDLLLHDFKKRNGGEKDPKELTRWFNGGVIKKFVKKKEGDKVDFYCFRHTFATTARFESDLELGQIDELCGWSSDERKWFRKAMRENYTKRGYGMETLRESMDRINYPSIDLTHLHLGRLKRIGKYEFELL